VTEACHDLRQKVKPVAALVRDQDTQVLPVEVIQAPQATPGGTAV
jgi:hypothetical protein